MNERKKVTLHIRDVDAFMSLRDEVQKLWYEHYGAHPNKGDILLSCLRKVRDDLKHSSTINSLDLSEEWSLTSRFARLSK